MCAGVHAYLRFQLCTGCTLTDVNECRAHTSKCDVHAECFNTDGSYRCECGFGFSGDGVTCTKICGKPNKDLVAHDILPGSTVSVCQCGLCMLAYMKLVNMRP